MLNVLIGLVPVLVFLSVLVLMDSFKLVPIRSVLQGIFVGSAVALVGSYVNGVLLDAFALSLPTFSRYVAPVSEELLKGSYVVYLVQRKRVGFLVDAAIHGFAIGAGFALAENIEYLRSLTDTRIFLWIVRGFGTALLHGATTSILAILSKGLADRAAGGMLGTFLPGFAAAIAIHSLFNHFILPPLAATALLLVALPLLIIAVFEHSEKATREWLGVGLDGDLELLDLIRSGAIGQTRIGAYLQSLKSKLAGPVVADMLCLLQIRLELSIRAKGFFLARESGIQVPVGDDVKANFAELGYLEKAVGKTGLLAMKPILRSSSRDVWQLHVLARESSSS